MSCLMGLVINVATSMLRAARSALTPKREKGK